MRRFLLSILLVSMATTALAVPPSEASVRRLLDISGARAAVELGPTQINALAHDMVRKALGETPLTAQQSAVLDQMINEMVAVIDKELAWEKLEAVFLPIYAEIFEQSEVDGMIAFYETEVGQAMARKQPLVQARAMRSAAEMQMVVMPKIAAIVERHKKAFGTATAQ